MRVTILGAGTAIPAVNRSPSSILLQGKTNTALVDLGPGTLQRAGLHGIDYLTLQDIFITHLHSDHTLDLVTLLQANDSNPLRVRKETLRITGPTGTQRLLDRLMDAYPGIQSTTYTLIVTEIGEQQWEWGDFNVSSIFTKHTENSLAYQFESEEGCFVFTGDAVLSESLVRFCSHADLLVCECSFPSGWATLDHMNADSAGMLAHQASVKHLVLTHLYPPAIEVNIILQISQLYSGRITIALDGSSFTLAVRSGLS